MIVTKAFGLSVRAVVVIGINAAAQILGGQTLELDFRDRAINTRAKWSNNDKLTLTNEGLGFNGQEPESIDVSIESAQPLAIGFSWRPAASAQIDVEVLPLLRAITLANGEKFRSLFRQGFRSLQPRCAPLVLLAEHRSATTHRPE